MDKNVIIKRSSALYSKYGIKSISVDDVAFMLGISKKTLYEVIENKNALIQKIVESNLDKFYEKIMQTVENDDDIFHCLCKTYLSVIKEVKRVNPAYVHDLKKYHNNQYKKIIDFRDNRLYQIVADCIQKGIESGIFRNDLDVKYIYFNQMHKVSIIVFDSVFECPESLSVQVVYKLILNDIRGITTLKGHEIFDRNYESLLKLK